MADMRRLLVGLQDYHSSLQRHVMQVRQEFQQLENRWHALGSVYEGTAAEEFRQHWLRTTAGFNEYVNQTQQISGILRERIDALEEADRAVGL